MVADMGDRKPALYHERQSLMRCAQHALNNLLQSQAFTVRDLEVIAKELHAKNRTSFINPHMAPIPGLGNYDVNVILNALQKKNLSTRWFDARRSVRTIRLCKVVGIIINTRGVPWLRFNFTNHWYSVRQVGDVFYNMDSKYREPVPMDGTEEVYTLLERVLEKEQGQVILVIEPGTTDQDLFEDAPPVAQESTPAGHSEGERRSDNVETTHKASEDT